MKQLRKKSVARSSSLPATSRGTKSSHSPMMLKSEVSSALQPQNELEKNDMESGVIQ